MGAFKANADLVRFRGPVYRFSVLSLLALRAIKGHARSEALRDQRLKSAMERSILSGTEFVYALLQLVL